MNKKVMALAVASVLAAPAAFAQSSNVQLYGRAVLGLDNYAAESARNQTVVVGGTPVVVPGTAIDYNSRNRVFDNSSRVGVRGTEDLGNGLKAIFQIESGVAVDSGQPQGAGGAANGSKGTWASRDSFVGIDSNFGRLTFGRQSIYWANGELAQFAANYINTEIPWTNGTSMGRISRSNSGAVAAVARQSNTVQYTTPTFFGLNGTVSYSPNAQEAVQHNGCVAGTNTTTNVLVTSGQSGTSPGIATVTTGTVNVATGTQCVIGTGSETNGQVWGATVRGNWGPFLAQFDWAENKGNSVIQGFNGLGVGIPLAPATTTTKWTGYKAGVGWKYMPGALVSFIWVQSQNNAAQGTLLGQKVTQNGYTINWEHTFGNFQVLAQYGWMDQMKGCNTGSLAGAITQLCDDTKADAFMVGGRYFLSKRTWLFASYNQVNNKDNNFVDYTGDAYSSVVNNGAGALLTPYGADPKIWALGIFHAF